jgi:lipid-A-disaccharide synthase
MTVINKKNLKIFIIAGEVSGDVLGAKIMREMPGVDFVGIGGQNMKAAGLKSLFPISDLAVMGLFEVLARARTLTKRINQTVSAIIDEKPDIVLTIDSPGFAKSVIKSVRNNGQLTNAKFYHVVAPQVWAWGAKRAGKYAKIFDRLYAFFDFEKPYFEKYGLTTIAVGHPISDGLKDYKKTVKNEKIITFIPGSRMSEVKRLLPVFHKTIDMLGTDYRYVIPTVETTDAYIRCAIKNWKIKPELVSSDERYNVYANTYIAVAASGTVSAELAIMHIPTIVVYKMNPLTVLLARLVVRIKWASLVNILMNKTIFPELLGSKATPSAIVNEVQGLTSEKSRERMIKALQSADNQWARSGQKPAALIAKDILSSI